MNRILHAKQGVETWITSDGRAYFVQLNDNAHTDSSASDLGGTDEQVLLKVKPTDVKTEQAEPSESRPQQT